MKKRLKAGAALILLASLAACGSSQNPEPVGIGNGINDLKRSPCADTPVNGED